MINKHFEEWLTAQKASVKWGEVIAIVIALGILIASMIILGIVL